MTTVDIRTPDGEVADTVELPGEIFEAQANIPLIHQVVVAQLAAARSGTHKTKTRGEVAGGGRKPYKQKGTGRARQGSIRAPQYNGGGVVHGPVPRDYSQRTPKKMKAAALRGVLSDRAREGRVHVVTEVISGETPSTRVAIAALGDWVDEGRVLVVLARQEETTWRSLRNVPDVALVAADQLSAYDAVVSNRIVFTRAGLDAFITRAAGGAGRSQEATAAGGDEAYAAASDEPVAADEPGAESGEEQA